MDKKTRMFAAIRGEEVDYPPCLAWMHFGTDYLSAAEVAERHIAFQKAYDWDICKVMHDYRYPFPDGMETIESPEDMLRFEPVGADSPNYAAQLEVVARVKGAFGDTTPVMDTFFDPVQQVVRRAGYRKADLLYQHPEQALRLLDVVTRSMCEYLRALKHNGCDGVHYSIIGAIAPEGERGISQETFETFLKPFDLRVLEAMEGMVRVVHVHGSHIDMGRVADYPCEVLSVSDATPGNLSLSATRAVTDKCLMGGLNEHRLHEYPLPILKEEMRRAVDEAGRRGFMLAPGCTLASHTAEHIVRCIRNYSRTL